MLFHFRQFLPINTHDDLNAHDDPNKIYFLLICVQSLASNSRSTRQEEFNHI